MKIVITEEVAIKSHLANITLTKELILFSGFIAALRDARKFTGRDMDTGVKLKNNNCGDHGSWLGAIGYLALLDQIGRCFKPKSAKTIDGTEIVKALRYFGGVGKAEADAIYALRCAFAHDFSLLNINVKKPHLTHVFSVCQGAAIPIVTLPKIPWDGKISDFNPINITKINLEALGDLVEAIYFKLIQLSDLSDLQIMLKGKALELHMRYSFCAPLSRKN